MKIKWGKMYEALSMVPGTLGELRDIQLLLLLLLFLYSGQQPYPK